MDEEIIFLGDCYFYNVSSFYPGFHLKTWPVYTVKVRDQDGVLAVKYFIVTSEKSHLSELPLPGSVTCDDVDYASMWLTSRNDTKAIEKLKMTIKLKAEQKIADIQYVLNTVNKYPEQIADVIE